MLTKIIIILIWFFAISKATKSLELLNQVEKFSENNGENKSFYHYSPEFSNLQQARYFPPKHPRILSDISTEEVKDQKLILEELILSLENLQFQPVVLLMDTTCQALLNTEYFTNKLLNKSNIRNEFWLMKFNASGVTNVIAEFRRNSEEIKRVIQTEKETIKNKNAKEGSATFFAILKASQILPKNSTILLFTESRPIDEDLAQLALTNLIQKKISLYVIWTSVLSEGRERLLRETSIYSNGSFYLENINSSLDCESITESYDAKLNAKEAILLRKTVKSNEKLQFSVDYTVKTLDIIIEGNVLNAVFTFPSGDIANLRDLMSEKRQFPGGINIHAHKNWTHVQFNTSKVAKHPTFGLWELTIISGLPNDDNKFAITIYVESVLSISTELVKSKEKGNIYSTNQVKRNDLQLNISGKISKIEQISLIDNTGKEIQNIRYNSMQNMKIQDEQNSKKVTLHISNVTIPKDSFYVQVTGSTQKGEHFSRLTYVEQNLQNRNLPMITIESSVRSNLLATPGSNPKVIFEVTNNYDKAFFVPFSVQDEKSMLRNLQPRGTVIPPKGSVEVTVFTTVPSSSTLQYTNLITLTAYGQVRAQKSALLYVNSGARSLDTTLPYLNYKFTSTCMEVPYSSCNSGIWAIEVTAHDAESGLLRVVSEPAGLYSPNNYVSGTKETVTLYYSNTCCQPNLDITAIDLNNNKYTYKVDAYHATLSTGSIVAITLGVILFLVIIVIAVILIRKCCKKRDSLDLPRYRGQTGSSTRF